MNILIIGNGFDLAHGLSTRYVDFLRFCKDDIDSGNRDSSTKNSHFVERNIWLKYFLSVTPNLDEDKTWIDFEKEIALIVQALSNANFEVKEVLYFGGSSDVIIEFAQKADTNAITAFLSPFVSYDNKSHNFVVNETCIKDTFTFIDFIYKQLKEFMREFEVYCLKINNAPVNEIITRERTIALEKARKQAKIFRDQARHASGYTYRKDDVAKYEKLSMEEATIVSSLSSNVRPIDYLSMSKFDCVLSFNYTNTYERLYGSENTQYCYVHGKAQDDFNKTNLVFGIDDDLVHGEESRDFTFVRFKKYYQRIIFKTGSEYKNWIVPKQGNVHMESYIHIVGHSLGKTDYEVLYEFISNNHFKIIVYYYCPEDYEDKVQNVIRLLAWKGGNGRDELIRRVHGDNWSIKFIYQYDESDGLFIRNFPTNKEKT